MESGFCVWFPVLVFLSGSALGIALYYLLKKDETPDSDTKDKIIFSEFLKQKAIESQLIAEENNVLESKLNKIHDQLNIILGKDLYHSEKENQKINEEISSVPALLKENKKLKKKIKNLKEQKKLLTDSDQSSHLKEYKSFLDNLEKSIKKAKKKTSKIKNTPPKKEDIITELEEEDEEDFKPGNMDKFKFYKEKFSKLAAEKDFNGGEMLFKKEKEEPKPSLTDLYGITPEIQGILAENDIFNFDDLSKMSISDLKHILSKGGAKFTAVNPLNWPLQARLAVKGHWDVIKEYKRKMDENK